MAAPGFAINVTVNPKDLARYDATLAKLQGKPLYERVDKSLLAAGSKIVVPEAKRLAPREQRAGYQRTGHKPGSLRSSIGARKARRLRFGEVAATVVKSRSPIAHLVMLGTRAHDLGPSRRGKSPFAAFGTDEVRATAILHHGGSRADPFMDRAREATEDAVAALVARDVFGALR